MAVAFLAAYAWPILDPSLTSPWLSVARVVTWGAWLVFAIDYLVRLGLSVDRRGFVRHNLFDLAVVVLPLLRPLRLLRLVKILSVLNRHAAGSFRGRIAVYVGGATSLTLFVASLAILDAERKSPDANVTTFGDALWWSFATVTTVGYGDRFPVTTGGRLVAVGLMLAGIALIGIVTATLASWILDKVAAVEEESQAATRRDVQRLADEVVALREQLQGPGSQRSE